MLTISEIQDHLYIMLKEFDSFCKENDIKYSLSGGSLLGAIRHKGFIPWDDDMDIGMLRKEYDKFVEIAPEKLNKEYFLQTWDTDENYPHAYAKVRKLDTVYIENVSQGSGAHNELFVDVFPYDVYPDDEADRKGHGKEVMKYRYALQMKNNIKPWIRHKQLWKRILGKMKYVPSIIYSKTKSRSVLKNNADEVNRRYNNEKTNYYFETTGATPYGKWLVPSKCLEELGVAEFEGIKFSVPADYDLYLKNIYGDYMKLPPIEKRGNQHQIIELKL